jgi:hypothetical protein
MKHANNMREKVTRMDNAEATAKKAAEEKRGTANLDDNKGRIEIGKGGASPGTGRIGMVGPTERMAPYDGAKAINGPEEVAEVTGSQKKEGRNKSTWIKGSSESKKMGGSHNVKGKL